MKIDEVIDKKVWDGFVSKNSSDTFLQSWQWGEFQIREGETVWRLGFYDNGVLVGTCLVVSVSARRGRFLFVPHGPIIDKSLTSDKNLSVVKLLTQWLEKEAPVNKCSFFRIAPIFPRTKEGEQSFHKLGYRDAPIHMHSEQSWVLDITPSDEVLLANMRKSTRYIIRHESDYDLNIKIDQGNESVEAFCQLYERLVIKRGFGGYNKKYLINEFASFLPSGARIYLAEYKKRVVAGAFIVFFGGAAFYHHGASDKDIDIPTSHLLHWRIIQDLKREGLKYYNFWGVAPKDKPKHPWQGLSTFKKGFGGQEKEYIKTKDHVVSPRYWFCFLVESYRKIRRHY